MLDRGLRRLVELRCNYVNGFLYGERWALVGVVERWDENE